MKRLAKLFRRWADKLDPPPSVCRVDSPHNIYTMAGTKKLQKFKAQVELVYPHDQREREHAERKIRQQIGEQVAKGVGVDNYARHVTAEFYYYE